MAGRAEAGVGGGGGEEELLREEEALLVADRLHLVVRPFLLRRLKADVAPDLPPKAGPPTPSPPASSTSFKRTPAGTRLHGCSEATSHFRM